MKNIYLTFDYELFFGEDSGSLENSILKPTNLLLDTLKECNAPATFYIDTIYIEKLLEYNLLDKYELVKLQIQRMIKEGHRVELHLHPHWYDAIYIPKTKRWKFPTYEHYRLHSYNEKEIEHIFDKSVDLLYKIVHEVDSDYKFYSYRAGGWCIQPFDKIKPSLEKHGIFVDSSVVPGFVSSSEAHFFDFLNHETFARYKFNDKLEENLQSGIFTEFPASVIKLNFFEKICNKLFMYFEDSKIIGDGIGIAINKKEVFFNKFRTSSVILSLENISKYMLLYCIKKNYNKDIVIVSHPKYLANFSYKSISYLHTYCKSNFKTFPQSIRD
jgi:hypothetical protein